MNPVKNIIFDLGNVLYDIDFTKMYQSFESIGIADFQECFTLNQSLPIFFELEKGLIDETTFFKGVRELIGKPVTDEQIRISWNSLLIAFRPKSIDWIFQHKNEYNMFLYSNTNQIHYDHFIPQFEKEVATYPFESLFVKPYYSHEMHQRKPDPSSFQFILDKEQLNASETLFIDDNKPNVVAAKEVGLKIIHLEPGMTVEASLASY
jgi:putative hydrolase of the HAD superfamily